MLIELIWHSYFSLSHHIDKDEWRESGQCFFSGRSLINTWCCLFPFRLSLLSFLLIHLFLSPNLSISSDEYKMKGVEEVKYMRGDENRVNARNQENLVRDAHKNTHTPPSTDSLSSTDRLRPFSDSSSTQANRLVFVSKGSSVSLTSWHIQTHCLLHKCKNTHKHMKRCLTHR